MAKKIDLTEQCAMCGRVFPTIYRVKRNPFLDYENIDEARGWDFYKPVCDCKEDFRNEGY